MKLIKSSLVFAGLFATMSVASASWYAGVSGGASSLRPDVRDSGFKVDSNVSFGGGVLAGYDIGKRISAELSLNHLGSASLSNDNRKTDIGYSSITLGGLVYLIGDQRDIEQRSGFRGFVQIGASSMRNQHDIPLERADNSAILVGVGLEIPYRSNLTLRGEIASFDGDAQMARIAAIYRPKRQLSGAVASNKNPAQQAPKAPQKIEAPVVPAPIPDTPSIAKPKIQQVPQAEIQPQIESPTEITPANCVAAVPNEPVDVNGCALFSGVLNGVEFVSGGATLTASSTQVLNELANKLQSHLSVVVEIQAHTESFNNPATARAIAKQRTIAVARYLVGRGIPVARLKARAFGNTQPIASANSAAGKQLNNRIELRVTQ